MMVYLPTLLYCDAAQLNICIYMHRLRHCFCHKASSWLRGHAMRQHPLSLYTQVQYCMFISPQTHKHLPFEFEFSPQLSSKGCVFAVFISCDVCQQISNTTCRNAFFCTHARLTEKLILVQQFCQVQILLQILYCCVSVCFVFGMHV